MKSGDLTVMQCKIQWQTRPYWPRDKRAIKIRIGEILDSALCDDPNIMFARVYYTKEADWSKN